MPTGYTAKLMEAGQSFEEFVMRCARAMGALITMRDEPRDAPIPERFEPNPYYAEELKKAKELLARLEQMGEQAAAQFGQEKQQEALARQNKWLKRESGENRRLADMLTNVENWKPPTEDHRGFKKFMIEQLEKCFNDADFTEREVEKLSSQTPQSFYNSAIEEAAREVAYFIKEINEEFERVKGRNKWITDLRESLKTESENDE